MNESHWHTLTISGRPSILWGTWEV